MFNWLKGKKESLSMATCTYCKGTKFYEFLHSDMPQNILCTNKDWFPVEDLHKVEPTEEEKESQKLLEEEKESQKLLEDQKTWSKHEQIRKEGRDIYSQGQSSYECLVDLKNRHTYPSYNDLIRLTGWLDENKSKNMQQHHSHYQI